LRLGLLAISLLLAGGIGWPIARWLTKRSKPVRHFPYGLFLVDDAGRPLGKSRGPLQLVLDPFALYRPVPNQKTTVFTINALGARGPLPDFSRSCVLVLGGSAAFGQELESDEQTFARQWHRLDPDLAVLNFAVPGYFAGQELALFTHHLRKIPCNIVLAFNGWNDVFDVVQGAPRREGFYGCSIQFFEVRDRLAAWHAGGKPASLPPPNIEPEARFQKMADSYLGTMLDLYQLALARGKTFVWVIQPELGTRPHPTDFEKAILRSWQKTYQYSPELMTQSFMRLRMLARQHAERHQIPFLDINDHEAWKQSKETLFADAVHPNARGHQMIAEILHRAILRGKIPSVPPSTLRSHAN
jgi:lysophospholipase L1-like esterase